MISAVQIRWRKKLRWQRWWSRPICKRRLESGFTLIEVLVALSLVAVVLVLLTGGLRIGTRLWERANGDLSALERIGASQMMLRRMLTSAYPMLQHGHGENGPKIYFDGNASEMHLLTPTPDALGGAGLSRVSLVIYQTGADMSLRASIVPERADDAMSPLATDLIERAAMISFSYFGREHGSDKGVWLSAWVDQIHLPALIRIRADFPESSHATWPDLVVAPMIAVDATCSNPLGAGRCQ